MVEKIIEFEILDPMWFELLRRHPELQVDADGTPAPLQRNHRMGHSLPRARTELLPDCLSGVKAVGELLAVTSATGLFRLLRQGPGQGQQVCIIIIGVVSVVSLYNCV
jgi:hypothetical protein